MTVFFLALRNVMLQRKRYVLMFLAITLGFTLVILIHSITYGALETVKTKAARYFSGHISITGYNISTTGFGTTQHIDNLNNILMTLETSDLPIRTLTPRTVYYRSDASLFFAGESVRQRRLIGIDFQKEFQELQELEFTEGSIEDFIKIDDSKGILISEVAAEILGARIGDDITLNLTTDSGQFNSETLIVRGIFRETSLFGYVAYMNREDLNSLLLKNPDDATDIAIYSQHGIDENKLMIQIRELLAGDSTLLPPMHTSDDLSREIAAHANLDVNILAPLTLEAHLDQITTIINAVKIVTWFIQVLFMLIIMVGILNTYRVLVYERTKEIGTLRAMGMTRQEVRSVFLYEAVILDLAASIIGFVLYLFIIKLIELLNLSGLPGSGIFTEKGHLSPQIDLFTISLTSILLMASVLIAAWGPANRASGMSPVDAIREEN